MRDPGNEADRPEPVTNGYQEKTGDHGLLWLLQALHSARLKSAFEF